VVEPQKHFEMTSVNAICTRHPLACALSRLSLSASAIVSGGEISFSVYSYLPHPVVLPWLLKPEIEFSAVNFGLWLAIIVLSSGAVIVMSYGRGLDRDAVSMMVVRHTDICSRDVRVHDQRG
jgi:hypothetical protein